ncbi:hypothetical protein ACF0H5_006347 [Mactra antiquata]
MIAEITDCLPESTTDCYSHNISLPTDIVETGHYIINAIITPCSMDTFDTVDCYTRNISLPTGIKETGHYIIDAMVVHKISPARMSLTLSKNIKETGHLIIQTVITPCSIETFNSGDCYTHIIPIPAGIKETGLIVMDAAITTPWSCLGLITSSLKTPKPTTETTTSSTTEIATTSSSTSSSTTTAFNVIELPIAASCYERKLTLPSNIKDTGFIIMDAKIVHKISAARMNLILSESGQGTGSKVLTVT